jgi:predicted alpha/beta superfamily hydrolase
MKRVLRLVLGWLIALVCCRAGGRFLPPEPVASAALGSARTVRIWLPPSYDAEPGRRYPVLYLHDGQNVFSSAGPEVAFGWGSWEVDLAVERLVRAGRMREVILVAIDNTPQRYQEYRGRAARFTADELQRERFDGEWGDNSAFERYARFLTGELKPSIDQRFRTLADPANTGILGSSLGGVCSLVLGWDHPDVFGLAASMSGAFQIEKRIVIEELRRRRGGSPKAVKLYLDCGTCSPGGDDGRAETEEVVAELRRIGWKDGADLRYFLDARPLAPEQLERLGLSPGKRAEALRSQHNELYWRLRVERPLEFLFATGKDDRPGRADRDQPGN